MTSPVLTFATSFPASEAWAEMQAERVRHAVVLDRGAIRGVVSTRDLGGIHGGSLRIGRAVGELMREDVVVASPEMSTARAAKIMHERRIGCLPIVLHGKLVGIVTAMDLLRALQHPPAVGGAATHPRQ